MYMTLSIHLWLRKQLFQGYYVCRSIRLQHCNHRAAIENKPETSFSPKALGCIQMYPEVSEHDI